MNTPICDYVKKYAESESARLHMPGHKGKGLLGFEHLDITEIEGADVLYSAKGIIKESMENASALFSTSRTLYSTEGSSLSIRAMLYLTELYAKEKGLKPLILAGRNVHKAFLSGAALSDIEVEWLYPAENEGLLSCKITPDNLRDYLENTEEKPVALYITSPDYLGNITDIKGLSKVCRAFDLLLLVDNAHGAYLNFLKENQHPISLGADICCDSAHKTLPVLTGGGYLHIGKSAPKLFLDEAENAMSLFASTSPSYLILESLDSANKYMSEDYRKKLSDFVKKAEIIKEELNRNGYTLLGDEALKITICAKKYGYKGTPNTLKMVKENEDLAAGLGAAAHLIHGSSEGRFTITYCPGPGVTEEEIRSVGFEYADLDETMKKYNFSELKDGFNTVNGEKIFYISNPALGLWALKKNFR